MACESLCHVEVVVAILQLLVVENVSTALWSSCSSDFATVSVSSAEGTP